MLLLVTIVVPSVSSESSCYIFRFPVVHHFQLKSLSPNSFGSRPPMSRCLVVQRSIPRDSGSKDAWTQADPKAMEPKEAAWFFEVRFFCCKVRRVLATRNPGFTHQLRYGKYPSIYRVLGYIPGLIWLNIPVGSLSHYLPKFYNTSNRMVGHPGFLPSINSNTKAGWVTWVVSSDKLSEA